MSWLKEYKARRIAKKEALHMAYQILDGGAVIANMDVRIPVEVSNSAINLTLYNIRANHDNEVSLSIKGKSAQSKSNNKEDV